MAFCRTEPEILRKQKERLNEMKQRAQAAEDEASEVKGVEKHVTADVSRWQSGKKAAAMLWR